MMKQLFAIILLALALVLPGFCIFRYRWWAVFAGMLAVWLLVLFAIDLTAEGEGYALVGYWAAFGWIVAVGYGLILWVAKGIFLLMRSSGASISKGELAWASCGNALSGGSGVCPRCKARVLQE